MPALPKPAPAAIAAAFVCATAALSLPACTSQHRPHGLGAVPQIGVGAAFHPRALSAATRRGAAIGRLRCEVRPGPRVGGHLELFARGTVVIVPAGIGVAAPQRRQGPYVRAGHCSYPLRTTEPTGVIEARRARTFTLGDFFAIWGQPLSRSTLGGFHATPGDRVRAFVDGRAWRGDPGAIPLRGHAEIVLEVGGFVPPHRFYRFGPGL